MTTKWERIKNYKKKKPWLKNFLQETSRCVVVLTNISFSQNTTIYSIIIEYIVVFWLNDTLVKTLVLMILHEITIYKTCDCCSQEMYPTSVLVCLLLIGVLTEEHITFRLITMLKQRMEYSGQTPLWQAEKFSIFWKTVHSCLLKGEQAS